MPSTDSPPVPRLVFVAIAAASVAIVGFLVRKVFLFWDDFVFLGESRGQAWTWANLADGLFEHFSPIARGMNLLVSPVLPGRPWLIWVLLMLAGSMVITTSTLMMVALFGRTRTAVVGAVLAGPTLSLLPLVNWWTAGMNIMFTLAAHALCLAGVAFLVRGGSKWWGVAVLAGYLVAVLDWEPGMLTAGYALLWVLLFRARVTAEPLVAVLRRTWWMWAGMVVTGGLALLNYRLNYYSAAPSAPFGQVLEAFWRSLFDTVIPSLLGFHDPSTEWVGRVGTVVGLIVLVGLVTYTLVRRRGAWRGWLFAGVGWFLPSAALIVNRVAYLGPEVAENIVYFYLPTTLFLVGALEAWVAPPRVPVRARQPHPVARRLPAITLIALVGLAYVRSAAPTVTSRVPYGADPEFVATAAASVNRIADRERITVLPGVVPESLVPLGFAPWNRLGNVLGLTVPGLTFDRLDGPYYVVDTTGALQPADVSWSAAVTPTVGGTLVVTGVQDSRSGPDGQACFRTVDGRSRVTATLAAPVSPVAGWGLVIRTLVTVDRVTTQTLTPAGGEGFPDEWSPGKPGRLTPVTTSVPVAQVVIDSFTPGTEVCLTSIAVGSVQPED